MYSKNNLKRNVLITPEEVIFHAPTKQTLDPRMIESSIIVAEERFIRTELDYEMYQYVCNAKNTIVTAGNEAALESTTGLQLEVGDIVNSYLFLPPDYQALWLQHLWKLISECVITAAYPEGFVQFGSEGALHNNPPAGLMVTSGFVTPLLTSMKWSVDKKVQDRIGPLVQSMHDYICRNKGLFIYYKRACPECDQEGKRTKWAGLAMGLYDDIDNDVERCC